MNLAIGAIQIDSGVQPRAALDMATVTEYAGAMSDGWGGFPPVVAFEDDGGRCWLADGFHRVAAAREAGLVTIPADLREGGRRDALLHACGANADHGLRRTNEDKRRAVRLLLEDEEWSGWSDREIARRARVGHAFVSKLRGSLSTVDSDRTYTTRHGTTATMDTSKIGRHEERDGTPKQVASVESGDAAVSAVAKDVGAPRALQSSASNEWYTPPEVLEVARSVLGEIDLDPASCEQANQAVGAASFYDKQDDGLASEWFGRVWLNPPYGRDDRGRSNQGVWSARLVDEYRSGGVDAAVMLVNAVTDRNWFRPLWDYAICFCYDRIRFYAPDERKPAPTHGNVLVYLGPDVDRFDAACHGKVGHVVLPRCSQ